MEMIFNLNTMETWQRAFTSSRYSQAKRIYGDDGVEELSDLFSTFIVLRCNGHKTAEWSAKQLGKTDNIEVNESLSYGLNSARDGANLQNTRRERDIVLSSQLQNLSDLEGFVRFGKGVPVASFVEKYKARETVAEAFILDEELTQRQMNSLISESTSVDEGDYFSTISGDVESSLHDSVNQINDFGVPEGVDHDQSISTFDNDNVHNSDSINFVDTFSDYDEFDRDL